MAFDGITIASLTDELQKKIKGGRISKVAQPEKDEILLTIKADENYRLFISANASLPLIYLTEDNKPNPLAAPTFCMLLRKHLGGARILDISQGFGSDSGLERMIEITFEHLDEMGDLCRKKLIVEIMGKHSNIILTDEDYTILDSIKRVNAFMSSVREVLPGRKYFLPRTVDKLDPFSVTEIEFKERVLSKAQPIPKAIYSNITGFSPVAAEEIVHRAGISGDTVANTLSEDMELHLFKTFERFVESVRNKEFEPVIVSKNEGAVEFSAFPLSIYKENGYEVNSFDSMSKVLTSFYSRKNEQTVIRQKSSDLRKIVGTAIEREAKKLDLQHKQLSDTEKREKYRVYGELITAYGYSVPKGSKEMRALNYYTNEEITIPLDSEIAPIENAKKYFDKYAKQKRTFEALTKFVAETEEALRHLNSVALSLEIATDEDDLNQIKKELTDSGYIRYHGDKNSKSNKGMKKVKTQPLHFTDELGIHYYVGKNNTQNDELTFGLAKNSDWWFHSKGCPGSHVIMVTEREDLPDEAFNRAGNLAAYYSSAAKEGKVEIDYVKKKEVKKPANAKPGFVVYYTNYSMVAVPSLNGLTLIS